MGVFWRCRFTLLRFYNLCIVAAAVAISACGGFDAAPVDFDQSDVVRVGEVYTLDLKDRVLSSLPVAAPVVNQEKAELGRLLFWDPVLSGGQDVACATCHLPEFAYTDGQARAIGVGGLGRGIDRVEGHTGKVPRNSQTLVNSVWNGINELGLFDPAGAPMFWDNRVESLVNQAVEPIESRQEMRGDQISADSIHSQIELRLNGIEAYRRAFVDAFGVQEITIPLVAEALAEFQSTLIANNSAFDQWMRGEPDAMTTDQLSGMQEFVIAGCADCHSGPAFSDFELHVLGVQEGSNLAEPDNGNGQFAFRTPTLRQLDFTAPYFHAGQFSTLARAIDFYDEPRRSANPNVPSNALDPELLEVPEMDDGRGAIIQRFLSTLNDRDFDQFVPSSVPSGLSPGGF